MANRETVRVLSLDGGGVRGLSALIILKKLLCMINEELYGGTGPVLATEVFDVIVGTSTGGLIALMMVKLNMTVDECIEQYKTLSSQIFGKPHFIGKRTMGFGTTKYSGTRLKKFVVNLIKDRKGLSEDQARAFEMEDDKGHPGIQCTVVCRELKNDWTKSHMDDPFFLCSHRCRKLVGPYQTCRMCDAARATSAAPTYFPEVQILKRILVDGGFGHTNNPSAAAWDHYRIENRSWSVTSENSLIWVNIGTGTLPATTEPTTPPRPFWTLFIPNYFLNIYHLTRDLQRIAASSEQVGKEMKRLARETKDRVQFTRFSADNGLHLVQLDDYEKIDNGAIEELTTEYLEKQEVVDQMRKTAQSLAASCRRRRTASRIENERNFAFLRSSQPTTTSEGTETAETTTQPTLATNPGRLTPSVEDDGGDELFATPMMMDVPDLSGRSEPTAEDRSDVLPPPAPVDSNETSTTPPLGMAGLSEADRLGMGGQFSANLASPTPKRPKRSSTSPARLDGPFNPLRIDDEDGDDAIHHVR